MFRKIIKELLKSDRKKFDRICKVNKLTLDFNLNKKVLNVLSSIFEDREYADYFPFYKKTIIVDVGAHYGFFSLFAAVNSDSQSRIISIEPDSFNFKHLKTNIQAAGFSNIETINCAIDKENGVMPLYKGASVNNSLIADYGLNSLNPPSESVQVKSLEEIMNEKKIDWIDFLKLDCEGAEYSILFNASSDLLNKIQIISMEFHDLKDSHFTGNELVNFLSSKGFKVVKFNYSKTNAGLNYGKLIATK